MTTTLITGNTYPVKDQIKALGGRWDRTAQGWHVPTENAAAAQACVDAAPDARVIRNAGRAFGRSRYGSRYTRFASGAEVFTNARGRCEDAPCCGCCS